MADDLRKDIIISVKTDTSEAEQGLDKLKEGLGGLNDTPVDKPFKTLKAQIKEATLEAQRMADEFGKNSTQFASAAQKVANLKDEFQEVNQAVAAFNPDNKLQALVNVGKGAIGTIQGVTGAMTFLGVESGTATETMAKLQGLMAFSDALNSVDDIKQSFKNFGTVIQSTTLFQKINDAATKAATVTMRVFGVAADTTSLSFKVLKTAMMAVPFVAVIVAITTLLPKIQEWISGTKDAEAAQRSLEAAIESLNHELDVNLKAIDRATESQVAMAKIAGKSQEEITKITVDGLKQRSQAALEASKQADDAYDRAVKTEGIKAEELDKYRKEASDKYTQYLDSVHAIDKADLDEKVRLAEEGRKKQKEADDKADADAKKRQSDRKAANEKAAADRKQALDEIKKINEEAQQAIAQSSLSEQGKELARLEYDFELKKAKFKKYGQDISTITQEYNINRAAIEQKYRDQINQFILEQSGNEYEIQKAEIEKKFDEQIKSATTFGQRLALVALESKKLLELEEQKAQADSQNSANSVALKAETTLINTQVDNRILATDDPETRKTKLQAINQAEIDVENAQFQAKLISLKGHQDEIEKTTAEHNARLKDLDQQLSDDREAIDEATLNFKLDAMNTIGNAVGSLGSIFDKGTVAAKSAALAEIAIGTGTGFIHALDIAQRSAKGTGPLAAFAFPVFYATQVAAVLGAAAKAKSILSTVKGGGGGGGTASAPAPVTTAPSINSTVLNNQTAVQDVRVVNQQDTTVKAYVSQRDLQAADDKSEFINKLSSFG